MNVFWFYNTSMTFATIAGITGGLLSLIAYIPRVSKIIREGSHSRNIWFIWTLSNLLVLISLYELGHRTTIWVPLAYFIGSAFVTILTFMHKAAGWTTLHRWLLIIALFSAVRWWFFESSWITLFLNIFIYVVCYINVIKVKLINVKKETWIITWALYFTGTLLNLFAITEWSIELSLYPIILFVMNGVVFSITFRNYLRSTKYQPETIEFDHSL